MRDERLPHQVIFCFPIFLDFGSHPRALKGTSSKKGQKGKYKRITYSFQTGSEVLFAVRFESKSGGSGEVSRDEAQRAIRDRR